MALPTIFVSIASYRDPELIPTLLNAIEMARNPNQLIFGICLQDNVDMLLRVNELPFRKQIRIDYVAPFQSQGCGWARSRIQKLLLRDEPYFLQLDSHHRFVRDWDALLLESYAYCKSMSSKPILTTYVCPYSLDSNLNINIPLNSSCRMIAEGFVNNSYKVRFVPTYNTIFPEKNEKNERKCRLSMFFSAHFVFTETYWVTEVPYDPLYYFDGEEDSLAIRSWLKGYDFYYPIKNIVFHLYTRQHRTKQWDEDTNWHAKQERGLSELGKLLSLSGPDTTQKRTLEEYEEQSGVHYRCRWIEQKANVGHYD
jgi:hypothetical protein